MNTPVPQPPPRLIEAARKVLAPLVRVFIAHGMNLTLVVELLKGVYLEVAQRHFRLEKGRMTDSRLSVLTGVHRKDVKRLREQGKDGEVAPRGASLGARVIGLWTGDAAYRDQQGRPRDLEHPQFEALVESVSKDVRPRTILDEWLRQGLVEWRETAQGRRLHLCDTAFVPSGDLDELAWYLGRNLHDHAAAAASNLLGEGPPRLERAVFYPGLTAASVAELDELARAEASASLQRLNQAILERLARDRGRADADHRFCYGVYAWSEQRQGATGESK